MSTSLVLGMNERIVGGGAAAAALPSMFGIHSEAAVAAVEKDNLLEATRKRSVFSSTNLEKQNLALDREESSESSSIGVASSDEENGEDGEEEVQSKKKEGAFGSLQTLEESLPMKRGLSNFFAGKSKSLAALSDLSNATARELAKPENPFNKRRRILMASKVRRASYGSLISAASSAASSSSSLSLFSPDHTVDEEDEGEAAALEEEEEQEQQQRQKPNQSTISVAPLVIDGHGGCDERLKMKALMRRVFGSPRSFSLSDLQQA